MADEYFSAGGAGVPARPGSWFALLETAGVQLAPGIRTRPIAGEGVMMTYVVWERDGVAPVHSHAEEQIFLLLEGEVEFEIDVERRVMQPGDVAVIPAWASHGGRGLAASSVAVEAFAPPRSALLAMVGPTARANVRRSRT